MKYINPVDVELLEKYRERWETILRLGAPVSANSITRSLMGATDTLIAASISPSAVAVVTISDLYRQLLGNVGAGIGGGAITLASQDTGAGADANRDESISQAAILSVLVAIPFALAAVFFGEELINLVGHGNIGADTVSAGAAYLAVTLVVAPITLTKSVFVQAFSAIGDTKTPFYVGAAGDVLNLIASFTLGLGFAPLGIPEVGIFGLGIATASAELLTAATFLILLQTRSPYTLVTPRDSTIAKQIVQIGLPQATGGFVTSAAVFPFSRIVIGFGTNIYAGYQIAWRLYQVTVGVLAPGLGVATKILVGQSVGEQDINDARFTVRAALSLVVLIAGTVGVVLPFAVDPLSALFADQSANRWTVNFARILGGIAIIAVGNNVLSAALEGASETRIGLVSRTVGMLGGMVGVTWVIGVYYDLDVIGAYAGIVACYLLFIFITGSGYLLSDWEGRADSMMEERGSKASDS